MGTFKVVEIKEKGCRQGANPGQTKVQTIVQFERSKNPVQKKQWVKATATLKRATFTEKAIVETELYFLPFMEAVLRAQAKWPNCKNISYTTLEVVAAKKDPVEAAEKKVE